jgi:hypothetical protein
MNTPFRTPAPPDAPAPRPTPSALFLRGIAIAVAVALAGGLLHRAAPWLHANVVGFIAAFLLIVTYALRAIGAHVNTEN